MALETDVAELRRELETVRHELGILQDVKAVRELQFKYGYYMDKCLFPAIVDLFADDAELYFLGGVYRGKAGARRLYGGARPPCRDRRRPGSRVRRRRRRG